MTQETTQRSTPAALGLAWAIVLLPTLWGLTHTVENALKLFHAAPPAATVSGPQGAGR